MLFCPSSYGHAGVVSWLFVLSAEVPQVGYSNRLDGFVNLSFACLFMQYVW